MKGKKKLKMSSPWITLLHEYDAMFGKDPDVEVRSRDDGSTICLYVNNEDKADALSKLLPASHDCGGMQVSVEVVPSNELTGTASLFSRAFAGNPVLNRVQTIEGVFTNPITYVVFANEVVQFWNDNLGDPHGNVSTLYQTIAGDVIGSKDGVIYCTATPDEDENSCR